MKKRGTALALLLILAWPAPAGTGWRMTVRVSTGTLNRQVAGPSRASFTGGLVTLPDFTRPSVSADGRYIAFTSDAADLVPGDVNGTSDVFVKDIFTSVIERVSGVNANGPSSNPSISGDGRNVAFQSDASNLANDTNGVTDVFVHDRTTGQTARVAPPGVEPNGPSFTPAFSSNGQRLALATDATNLAPGDTNNATDIFLVQPPTFQRVSLGPGGAQADQPSFNPSISAMGDRVAFESAATTLDPSDRNLLTDVFVRDVAFGFTVRASRPMGGGDGDGPSYNGAIAGSGRTVAFESEAANLVPDFNGVPDVFLAGVNPPFIQPVSQGGNGRSGRPSMGGADTLVAFESQASNFVADLNGVSDVFLRDLAHGSFQRVSVSSAGAEGNGRSFGSALSTDGGTVAFDSDATNLVSDDTNGFTDVFASLGCPQDEGPASGPVRDLGGGTTHAIACLLAGVGL